MDLYFSRPYNLASQKMVLWNQLWLLFKNTGILLAVQVALGSMLLLIKAVVQQPAGKEASPHMPPDPRDVDPDRIKVPPSSSYRFALKQKMPVKKCQSQHTKLASDVDEGVVGETRTEATEESKQIMKGGTQGPIHSMLAHTMDFSSFCETVLRHSIIP